MLIGKLIPTNERSIADPLEAAEKALQAFMAEVNKALQNGQQLRELQAIHHTTFASYIAVLEKANTRFPATMRTLGLDPVQEARALNAELKAREEKDPPHVSVDAYGKVTSSEQPLADVVTDLHRQRRREDTTRPFPQF